MSQNNFYICICFAAFSKYTGMSIEITTNYVTKPKITLIGAENFFCRRLCNKYETERNLYIPFYFSYVLTEARLP